ncbi:hypothetical protein LQ939_15230 [Pantoea alhagi]|uniref:hypothetical protein n=1 Tax=Pantoea alhagi TaxID=1891675 RepID=UPI001F1CEE7C|nr:hypothetical protein [Pantoea alhagi]URQ60069.1 hypothetical protein LQ939_15230 [Pantoea alhagi]
MMKKTYAALALSVVLSVSAQNALAEQVKNIVLVHGAFADGSGWGPVATPVKYRQPANPSR